jgi:glycerol-3-phosphate dehydrogenase
LKADAAFAHLPTMRRERLASAYLYYDAAADDARLTVAVAQTAAANGAAVANRCSVVGITKDVQGKVTGAEVEADGRRFRISAKAVVNATGVWADSIRTLDEGTDPDSIRPAKGVHITVPWSKVRNDIAVVIPVPKDKRSLFVVPWGLKPDGTFEHTYVGTTDTDYQGPLDDPQCTKEDIDYVLRALNASVTTGITVDDVTGVWAGLRPLVKSAASGRTADLSRRHKIAVSDSGVVSIAGGKLTTYREMAEDTVDVVLDQLGRKARCRTRRLPLAGATGFTVPGLQSAENHLASRFGSLAADVKALATADPSLAGPIAEGLPYLRAEAVYAVRAEMARTLDDVLSRRTRARLLDRDASVAAAESVARLIAPELGWDEAEIVRQVAEYRDSCAHEAASGKVSEAELYA